MNNRDRVIENEFTNVQLVKNNMYIYCPRTSIYKSVVKHLYLFHGKVLDIGCGIMPYKETILKNEKVSEYIGMDLANAEYHSKIPPDLEWDGFKIPLPDNSINSILATEFLEHYHDTAGILAEINRVLVPGGIFFGTVPFIWNLHELPYDEYRFTPFSLEKLLFFSGFANIKVEALGGANLALAQLLGIWNSVEGQKLPMYKRKIIFWLFKWLVTNDRIPNKFDNNKNSLFNGLSFVAYKK